MAVNQHQDPFSLFSRPVPNTSTYSAVFSTTVLSFGPFSGPSLPQIPTYIQWKVGSVPLYLLPQSPCIPHLIDYRNRGFDYLLLFSHPLPLYLTNVNGLIANGSILCISPSSFSSNTISWPYLLSGCCFCTFPTPHSKTFFLIAA